MPAGANVTSPFVIAGHVPVGVGMLGRAPSSLDGASTAALPAAASGFVSELDPAPGLLAPVLHAATKTNARDGVLIAGDQTRNEASWLDRVGHAFD
jgi:hypothetical protein